MTVVVTGTLDTNVKDAKSNVLTMTTETLVSLYVIKATGTCKENRIIFEASPDSGTTFVEVGSTLAGTGYMTEQIVATDIQISVAEPEGSTSTVTYFIIAR